MVQAAQMNPGAAAFKNPDIQSAVVALAVPVKPAAAGAPADPVEVVIGFRIEVKAGIEQNPGQESPPPGRSVIAVVRE